MSIFILLLNSVIGFLFFLFFYWRRLREDYESSLIFSSGILMFLFSFVGGLVGYVYLGKALPMFSFFDPSGVWFWCAILFYFLIFLFFVLKTKMSFFETFEASSIGLLLSSFFVFLADFLIKGDYVSLSVGLFVLILFVLFLFLDFRYKSFGWYKSGRVGFSGLGTLGILFLLRSIVAILGFSIISLSGRIDGVVSGALAFLMFFSIYNLS